MGHPKKKYITHTYKGHFSLPAALLALDDMKQLSAKALKLLIDLGAQFNGRNNGDLCATLSMMRLRGWNSNDTLTKAKKELLERNLILETKQGGLGIGPSLYAVTWQPIHECNGKLEVASTLLAPRKLGER